MNEPSSARSSLANGLNAGGSTVAGSVSRWIVSEKLVVSAGPLRLSSPEGLSWELTDPALPDATSHAFFAKAVLLSHSPDVVDCWALSAGDNAIAAPRTR